MMKTFSPQNSRKENHSVLVCPPKPEPSSVAQLGTIVAAKMMQHPVVVRPQKMKSWYGQNNIAAGLKQTFNFFYSCGVVANMF